MQLHHARLVVYEALFSYLIEYSILTIWVVYPSFLIAHFHYTRIIL